MFCYFFQVSPPRSNNGELGRQLRRLGGQLGGQGGGDWLCAVFGVCRGDNADHSLIAQQLEGLLLSVRASGLLSRTIDEDELAEMGPTGMGFLMLEYMVGRAYEKAASASPVDDQSAPDLMKAALDRYSEFEKLAEGCGVMLPKIPPGPGNPAAARTVKIARYRERKELMTRLKETVAQSHAEPDDSDLAREVLLVSMRIALMDMAEARVSIAQEIVLRSHGAERMASGVDAAEEAQLAREQALQTALRQPGAMPANFVIDSRQNFRDAVFQPSHRLPRYTVEQFGEMEARRMRGEAQAQAAMAQEKAIQEIVEREERPYLQRHADDDHEVLDAEAAKAREWDDWKDDHNKGGGNTLR